MATPPPTSRMPALFVSHGAPTLAIEDGPAHGFLRGLGTVLGKPRAILLLSAHFEAGMPTVTAGARPGTLHDFGGFPPALYELRYPAPGDPQLAEEIMSLLDEGGIDVRADAERAFDHGAWVPLLLMYPQADVPLVQLSIDPDRGTAYHYRLGALLYPLREQGILIVGSGGATHNLRLFFASRPAMPPPDWVVAFNEWLADAVLNRRHDDLLRYRERAPYAQRNHPTEEHYMPLLVPVGASTAGESVRRIHHSFANGVLSMDAYLFGAEQLERKHRISPEPDPPQGEHR